MAASLCKNTLVVSFKSLKENEWWRDFTYLDRLLKSDSVVLTKANSSPLKHLSLLSKVGDGKSLVLSEQGSVWTANQVINLVEQVLTSQYPCVSFWNRPLSTSRVKFTVVLRVLEFQISLLYECWDLFELFVSIVGVMEKNAVEDFSEMGVEVLRYVAPDVTSFAQLTSYALQGLFVDAHYELFNFFFQLIFETPII